MQPGSADDDGSRAVLRPSLAPRRSRRWRRAGLAGLVAVGLCGLAVSAAGVASQVLPRRFSVAQQHKIEAWEVARRWRALPESAIFPATVPYQLSGTDLYSNQSLPLTAHRLAVSNPATCQNGTSPTAARVLGRYRCTAMLRATYTDATGSMVATVGVAVLSGSTAASTAEGELGRPVKGAPPDSVRPAAVPGTLAARFDDRQRQVNVNSRSGPYLILATVGYANARPRVDMTDDPYLRVEMTSLAQGLESAVTNVLGPPAPVPSCPGAPGC
jgi:hypothetical protein